MSSAPAEPRPENREERIDEIIAAYAAAVDAGEAPDPRDILRRNPDLAEELREFFDGNRELGREMESLKPPPPGLASCAPQELAGYEIETEIARGGMGIVYRARQKSLGRQVALKMILAGSLAAPEEVRRFRNEAEAAARLDHPNIVPIFEVGEHAGRHFFSMKLVDGSSLAACRDRFTSDPRAAARLIETVARAVHYAHLRGVLHRDLKPANLLIDASDQPHVTDFGLARSLGTDSSLTRTGAIVGTPAYMAPEQASGKADRATPAVDVYALGVILYELIAGRTPFRGDTSLETLRAVEQMEPQTPRSFNPSAPRDLETVCLKCIQKDPRKRYENAAALADDLQRFLAGRPIEARRASVAERAWRWCRRNPTLAAIGVLLVVIASGSFAFAWRLRQERAATLENLWRSSIEQARAGRFGGRAGQRLLGLEALRTAAKIRPTLELRNEAIGCLALADIEPVRQSRAPMASGKIITMAVDGTLQRYAIGEDSGTITVRRAADDSEEAVLSGGGARVASLGFSPDGELIGAFHEDGPSGNIAHFAAWSLRGAPAAIPLDARGCGPRAWSFHPREPKVAVGEKDGRIGIHDLAAKSPPRSFESGRPLQSNSALAFDPAGKTLAVVVDNLQEVLLLDVETGSVTRDLGGHRSAYNLAWHPSGTLLAVCDARQLVVWNTTSGEKTAVLTGHVDRVESAAFSPSQPWVIATSSWDGTLRLWNWETGSELVERQGGYSFRFSADGEHVGWVNTSAEHGLWRIEYGAEARAVRSCFAPPDSLLKAAMSPDGRCAAIATHRGVNLYDLHAGAWIGRLPGNEARYVGFEPDGTLLVWCASGLDRWPVDSTATGTLRVGPPESLPFKPRVAPGAAALSRDGATLLLQPFNQAARLQVVDTATWTVRAELESPARTWDVDVSADARWAAAGTWQSSGVRVWNVREAAVVAEIPTPGSARVAFSPDGRSLVVAPATEYVSVEQGTWTTQWKRAQGGARTLPGTVLFSNDGKLLAVEGSYFRDLLLLDPATGEELATLPAPRNLTVQPLLFSPRGDRLLALCTDGLLELWDLGAIRRSLRAMELDWDRAPPPPAAPAAPAVRGAALRLEVQR